VKVVRTVAVVAALAVVFAGAGSVRQAVGAEFAGDFTPRGVSRCLHQARSSVGTVLVGTNPYISHGARARAVVQFTLMPSDYGLPGVTILFAPRRSDTARLRRATVRFLVRERLAEPRSLVFGTSANVVFYYEKTTLPEIVRIAKGCIGGPVYQGDGGTPPPPGLPIP
jgi:hypothetical protein